MKKFLIAALFMLLAMAPASATSAASLNGTYNFQLIQSSTTSTQTCANVQSGTGKVCFNLPTVQIITGTISFNGKGSATFLTCSSCDGHGGPVIGHAYTYTVSGFVANINGVPNGDGGNCAIALSMGSFNPSGVATTALILVSNSGDNPLMGSANLR